MASSLRRFSTTTGNYRARLSGNPLERIAINQPGMKDVLPPMLAPDLRWLLKTKGPQPLRCMKTGKPLVPKPYMKIEHVRDMNFDVLPGFVTSSRDARLIDIAEENDCLFAASTSSMTSVLSHMYYALSHHRELELSRLSSDFNSLSSRFTIQSRKAASILLRKRGSVYGIDSFPSAAQSGSRVLMDLGKALECKLTMSPEEYADRVLNSSLQQPALPEAYAFTKVGKLLVRSQLDCRDDRGEMFDLKTRAVLAIRHNVNTYEEHLHYVLNDITGEFNSYEREWYDMARTVLMKYSFQVRLGRMTGVFVAYHNTNQIFGMEYVPIASMDQILFGSYASLHLTSSYLYLFCMLK